MAARELARAGKRVTILEARDRCGGRIHPLPTAEFGYPAEGGAEFVHGEAPVTHGLLREARLSLLSIQGTQWTAEDGKLSREGPQELHEAEFHKALRELKDDLTVAEFLRRYFAGPQYARLRHSIERMVEGYDAADPERASTLALRDEWMDGGRRQMGVLMRGCSRSCKIAADGEDAALRTQQRGQDIPGGSNRSPFHNTRSATAIAARLADPECPSPEGGG